MPNNDNSPEASFQFKIAIEKLLSEITTDAYQLPEALEVSTDESQTVVFLDIDGVLDVYGRYNKIQIDPSLFKIKNIKEAFEKLNQDVNNSSLIKEFIGAPNNDLASSIFITAFGFNKQCVDNLINLCTEFNARIVLSSSWRKGRNLEQIKNIFAMHGLSNYVIDKIGEDSSNRDSYRHLHIQQWLDNHPNINQFIVLDDNYQCQLKHCFSENFIHCNCYRGFTGIEYNLAKSILKAKEMLTSETSRPKLSY